jgi:hypothetical protein
MIDTFCQLGYLNALKHKTSAMEIRVNADFMDADELMIILAQDVLEGRFQPGSTTIHPNLGVSESRKALTLLQPKIQPLSKRTRSNTKPPPTIGLTEKESTLRSERLKNRIKYCEKDDDDKEGEVDNKENDECEWKSNHTVIDSGNSQPTIGVTKTESKVQSRSSKRRKTNNKQDYQDKDEDYQDKDDDAKEYDESEGGNNQRGISSDKSKWSSRYKDKSFWPDNGGYNLEE